MRPVTASVALMKRQVPGGGQSGPAADAKRISAADVCSLARRNQPWDSADLGNPRSA